MGKYITDQPTPEEIIAAYIRDRAEQYDQSSGYVAALYDLASAIRKGEANAAYEHGELDDLLSRFRQHRRTPTDAGTGKGTG